MIKKRNLNMKQNYKLLPFKLICNSNLKILCYFFIQSSQLKLSDLKNKLSEVIKEFHIQPEISGAFRKCSIVKNMEQVYKSF